MSEAACDECRAELRGGQRVDRRAARLQGYRDLWEQWRTLYSPWWQEREERALRAELGLDSPPEHLPLPLAWFGWDDRTSDSGEVDETLEAPVDESYLHVWPGRREPNRAERGGVARQRLPRLIAATEGAHG